MKPEKVVVHHSASDDGPGNNTAAIRDWHINHNGWTDVGYNALCELVSDTYEIIMGRPWDRTGAHTIGENARSLGICLVGNFMLAAPPIEQLRVAAKQVAFWCRLYNIPTTEIYRHSFFNATDCPGDYFDLEQFRSLVMDL